MEKFKNYEEIQLQECHATLDSKVLVGLNAILHGEFRKKVYVTKEKCQQRMHDARQAICLAYPRPFSYVDISWRTHGIERPPLVLGDPAFAALPSAASILKPNPNTGDIISKWFKFCALMPRRDVGGIRLCIHKRFP